VELHRRGSSDVSMTSFISLDFFGDVCIHSSSPPSSDEVVAWERYFDMEPFPSRVSAMLFGGKGQHRDVQPITHDAPTSYF
jgi:hypothetical protein